MRKTSSARRSSHSLSSRRSSTSRSAGFMARSCICRFFFARAESRIRFFFSLSSALASRSGRAPPLDAADTADTAVPGRDPRDERRDIAVPGRSDAAVSGRSPAFDSASSSFLSCFSSKTSTSFVDAASASSSAFMAPSSKSPALALSSRTSPSSSKSASSSCRCLSRVAWTLICRSRASTSARRSAMRRSSVDCSFSHSWYCSTMSPRATALSCCSGQLKSVLQFMQMLR